MPQSFLFAKLECKFLSPQTPNAEVPPGGLNTDGAEEDPRPMVYDAHDKKTLVLSVRAAVEKLVTHFSTASSQQEKIKLGVLCGVTIIFILRVAGFCNDIYFLLGVIKSELSKECAVIAW